MPIRACVFDLDGVITDTAEYHYQAWKALAESQGLPFTRADNDSLRGVSRQESLRRLLRGRTISEPEARRWLERKNADYLQFIKRLKPEDRLPGVDAFLRSARGAGMKLAIASASKNARLVLERLGLDGRFDVIGDGHSVAQPKPAPDLFLWVAAELRLPAGDCLVFEDAEAGVDAAIRAGCRTVGIGAAKVDHADIHLPGGLATADLEALLIRLGADRSIRE